MVSGHGIVSDHEVQIVRYVQQMKIIVVMELYKQEMVKHVMMEMPTTTTDVTMIVRYQPECVAE
jgi:hypothetical protein